jgi:hypothetical protein
MFAPRMVGRRWLACYLALLVVAALVVALILTLAAIDRP